MKAVNEIKDVLNHKADLVKELITGKPPVKADPLEIIKSIIAKSAPQVKFIYIELEEEFGSSGSYGSYDDHQFLDENDNEVTDEIWSTNKEFKKAMLETFEHYDDNGYEGNVIFDLSTGEVYPVED